MRTLYIESSNNLEGIEILKSHFQVEAVPPSEIVLAEGKKVNRNFIKKKAQEFFQNKEAQGALASEETFYLLELEEKWHLLDKELNYLSIDFDEDHLNYKRKSAGKKELLFKALGTKTTKVLDLTCGLGIDSVFLVRNGYHVESVERHPLVFFLLNKAQEKSEDPLIPSLHLHFSEAKDFIVKNSKKLQDFDAIYFDPMYPEKGKVALSRQEMQLFKSLVGKDEDASEILAMLKNRGPRIVIKRPVQGRAIDEATIHQFVGKTVRYDIY